MADCDVESAIERLEAVLDENYLRAERIMSLRSPKTDELDKISGVINQTFEKLLEAMALASLGSEAIVALTNSKQEFDARKSEWLSKLALTHEPPHSSELPPLQLAKSISKSSATSVSLSSKRSSASSKISFKLLQAKAKLRIAQLEAQHEEERAKEEQLLKRRETQRKIALAETELQVYEEAMEDSVSCSRSTKQTITHTAVTLSGATVNTSTISNKENEFATLSKESNLTTSSSSSYFRPEDKPALSLFQKSTDVSLGDVLPSQSFPTAFKLGCDSFPSLSSSTSVPSSCSVLTTTNVCTQIASASSCSDSCVTKLVGSVQNEFPTNQIPFPGFPAPQGPMFSGLILEPGIGGVGRH